MQRFCCKADHGTIRDFAVILGEGVRGENIERRCESRDTTGARP